MSHAQPAATIGSTSSSGAITSVRPVVLPTPERGTDLQLRVSVPAAGEGLPVVVFSHGARESMDGYSPLAEFWAAQGFVVVQPTHLDSQTLGITPDDPRAPSIWRQRIDDLRIAIDALDVLQRAVPGLGGRVDGDRIAVAGHSWGATTASALLGARVLDAAGDSGEDFADPRVTAGVLLALAGTGGDDLTPFAAEHLPFMHPDFSQMAMPSLIVAGDRDQSPLTTRGPDWWTDAFALSPGDKRLLTLLGAEHSMGGITGFSTHATTDWSFDRIQFVQQVTTAYLRTALGVDREAWPRMEAALSDGAHPLGRLESR